MSDHTAASLAKLDVLLPLIKALPASPAVERLTEEAEALRRACAAFHMEAIRFRIYNVDRLIKQSGDDPTLRRALEEVRQALEAAGFHTRSHVAP
jgi:hypothetical protein